MSNEIEKILEERNKTHGSFLDHSAVAQGLKKQFDRGCLNELTDIQKEGVDMILHKLARIATGDPDHRDHWDDIAGYATLVSGSIKK